MPHDDPFTLDLFGSTTLSAGLGLGVTAFGCNLSDDPDDEPDPPSPPPARAAVSSARRTRTNPERGENFFLDGDRGLAAN